MADVLLRKDVKIRKPNYCYFCCRKFEKGNTMHKVIIADMGDIGSCYSCLTCEELKDKYREYTFDDYENVYIEGSIVELLQDEFPVGTTPEDVLCAKA